MSCIELLQSSGFQLISDQVSLLVLLLDFIAHCGYDLCVVQSLFCRTMFLIVS